MKPLLSLPILLFLFCMAPASGAEKQPLRKQFFNHDWRFFLGDPSQASEAGFDDKNWRTLDLPHDWSIEGKIDPNHPMGNDGGYFQSGVGWYRKSFEVPATWKGQRIAIYFEGVYMNSEVFINGKSLGVYPYGYSSFRYDLTPYLDYGKPNLIAVRVDNSQQVNSRWYSGSGIYRHVWLEVTPPVHVAPWGVAVTTPVATPQKATVLLKASVKNQTNGVQKVTVKSWLRDSRNIIVGSAESKIELPANSQKEVEMQIAVSNPLLWSPETPTLYNADIQIPSGKDGDDFLRTPFGIRTLRFSTQDGFQLNGKTVKLNGGCVHHDNGSLGASAFTRAEERRVEILKAAGFNAIRTSHNPPSEAFLDACDRLGMLVMDESFDGWREKKTTYDYALNFDTWWQRDVEAMVLRDRNHPSIIMWSTGNEIIERKSPEAVETASKLAAAVRNLDPSRPVTSAITTWDREWAMFDPLFAAHDIGGYNYQLHRAASDHERVPSRIIVQTESYPRDAFANWKLVQNNNYIIGDFVWTALDYLGESGIGRWYYPGDVKGEHYQGKLYPWHAAYCGDIDLTGWRKPISHYRSMLYNTNEKLYMAVREPQPASGKITVTGWAVWPTWERWNWPGYEGKEIEVEIYSHYPEVRLYLNNQLLGQQPTSETTQFKATFSVPYAPGILKAVGVANGKEQESKVLQTAADVAAIRLLPDRTKLTSDGQDLSFVEVQLTDAKGVLKADARNRLQFSVSGPGLIAGVDNADISDTTSYASTSRAAWNGRALVVIRSTRATGNIKLTVRSEGLRDATITLKTAKVKPEKQPVATVQLAPIGQPNVTTYGGGGVRGSVRTTTIISR